MPEQEGSDERATLNTESLAEFLVASRRCASTMRDGAAFIQKELPKVRMSEALRTRLIRLCDDLVGTEYDVAAEIRDFHDPIPGQPLREVWRTRVTRINRWLYEDLPGLHEIVQALDAAARSDPADGGAYILVAETAVGILDAYAAVRGAAARTIGIAGTELKE